MNRFVSCVVLVGIGAVTCGTLLFFKPPIVAVYILLILGGAFFVGISFSRRRLRSRWARGLLIVTGTLLVVMEAVDLLRYYALWMPSGSIQHAVLSMIPIVEGIVLGLLIALILSGELAGRKIFK